MERPARLGGSSPSRVRPVAARMAVLGMAVLGMAVMAVSPPSGAASTYSASAGGETVRALVRVEPPVLQTDLLDPGAVTAQASFTSFGESTAFASDPYPGSLAVSLPGLLAGVVGSDPRVPPDVAKLFKPPGYPLIASSSYPNTPQSKASAGPVLLTADSEQRSSQGVAVDGANRTEASVRADTETDTVTARAVTEIATVDLGPLLTVSGVRGVAEVVQTASGERQRSTEFSVASLVVLGQALRVTPDGIEFAGVEVPIGPGGARGGADSLLAALEQQGVTLRFVDATETADGVISAGLVITRRFDDGLNGAVVTVQTTVGRTFAATSNTARPPLPNLDFGDLPAEEWPGSFPADPAPSGGDAGFGALPSSPPDTTAGARGSDLSTDLPTPPAIAGVPGDPGSAGDLGAGPVAGLQPARGLTPDRTDAGRFYPVLIVSGAVLALAVSLFRTIGVKPTWT